MILAVSPDAEDFAAVEFARISREYLGVWLFSSEIAKAIVRELLDRGFRVKLNGVQPSLGAPPPPPKAGT